MIGMAANGNSVTIQVPATSANCGPGFDCLGLACTLYNTFTYTLVPKERGVHVISLGMDTSFVPTGRTNLAAQAFFHLWDKLNKAEVGLQVVSHIEVPVSRGLGSSSTAVVAGLMAANVLGGAGLNKQQLVTEATEMEGHPDNVAPAILGGMTASVQDNGQVYSLKLPMVPHYKLVVLVPDMQLPTAKARAALPKTISHKDAVYSVSRAALLIGSMVTGHYEYLPAALQDKLHQPYRLPLIPGAEEAFAAAREAGAYNAVISGSGSTLMAYVPMDGDVEKVGKAMQEPFAKRNIHSVYHVLKIDDEGAKVL